MKRAWFLLISVALLLAACSSRPSPFPTSEPSPPPISQVGPSPTPQPGPSPTPQPGSPPTSQPAAQSYAGLPLPADRGELFAASGLCAACHTNMVDGAGADVSTDAFWRASMMANAARDPYWQASVRAEILSNPEYRSAIEDKCSTCHMPMARFSVASQQQAGQVLDAGFVAAENSLHALAMEGVSCSLCHQIREEAWGEHESFSGGYAVDTTLPAGDREAFGPYPVGVKLAQLMQASSGFVPTQGLHVERSELCATCHMLYTPYVDAAGQIAGEFPEQTPYLEWLASDYRETMACQDCHMPLAQGGVQLSITGGPMRSPFFQHVFVGGNAYMLSMLQSFGQDLALTASGDQFQEKQARTLEQLQGRTATVALENGGLSGSILAADVVVTSQAGHKFPSGFPSRRAWIHLVVQDGSGRVVFESGAVRPDGSIVGNDSDEDPAAFEPHYAAIDAPDQVQIYEAILGDIEGAVTRILLRASGYLKDNRLLPAGFDGAAAAADIAVRGAALQDEDFGGGGDRIRYTVDLAGATGPFAVTAELLYQSISSHWVEKLGPYDAAETARFLTYYQEVSNQPVVIASATAGIQEE